MTTQDFIAQLVGVRRTSRGWLAKCPAHQDKNPSLSVREGDRGTLVKCWTGCSAKEIVAAMGLTLKDLFTDAPCSQREWATPAQRPLDWRRVSSDFLRHAEDLRHRAETVLDAARGMDCGEWTDADVDDALATVAWAYHSNQRADLLSGVAYGVRVRGIDQERKKYEPGRCAA